MSETTNKSFEFKQKRAIQPETKVKVFLYSFKTDWSDDDDNEFSDSFKDAPVIPPSTMVESWKNVETYVKSLQSN